MHQSLKTQLSLASLLFFWPLVQISLNKWQFSLTPEEMTFVRGYAKMGWFALGIFVISCGSALFYYFSPQLWIDSITTWSTVLLLLFLVAGIIGILTDTSISHSSRLSSLKGEDASVTLSFSSLLLSYLPLVHIYIWYRDHDFATPNLFVKEGILAWMLFALATRTMMPLIPVIILILILFRIVTLSQGIDILGPRLQKIITSLFTKNPEEIRGNIIGTKNDFSYLGDITQYRHIQIQYSLFIITLFVLAWQNLLPLTNGFFLAGFLLIIGRYILMVVAWKHLPQLPVFKEVTQGIVWIIKRLGNKHFSS